MVWQCVGNSEEQDLLSVGKDPEAGIESNPSVRLSFSMSFKVCKREHYEM